MRAGDETIVVVDSIRSLLRFEEETNSTIARALLPWVGAARRADKTLILVHHDRKGGGEHGEGISGPAQFLAVVDVALEIKRDAQGARTRRRIEANARLIQPEPLLYERAPTGRMLAVGEPDAVSLAATQARVLDVLPSIWTKTSAVLEALSEPRPSGEQVRRALWTLASEHRVLRDPPIEDGEKPRTTPRWRNPGAPAHLSANALRKGPLADRSSPSAGAPPAADAAAAGGTASNTAPLPLADDSKNAPAVQLPTSNTGSEALEVAGEGSVDRGDDRFVAGTHTESEAGTLKGAGAARQGPPARGYVGHGCRACGRPLTRRNERVAGQHDDCAVRR
jgi:hypothetical protein